LGKNGFKDRPIILNGKFKMACLNPFSLLFSPSLSPFLPLLFPFPRFPYSPSIFRILFEGGKRRRERGGGDEGMGRGYFYF